MRLSDEIIQFLKQTKGIHPITPDIGIQALEKALQQEKNHVMVYHGEPAKIRQSNEAQHAVAARKPSPAKRPGGGLDRTNLNEQVKRKLIEIACEMLKQPNIEINQDLMQYGFDSISITLYTNKINELFQLNMMPTVIFELELPTIANLTKYLCDNYLESLQQYYGYNDSELLEAEVIDDSEPVHKAESNSTSLSQIAKDRFSSLSTSTTSRSPEELSSGDFANDGQIGGSVQRSKVYADEPIAIIGMHGIFPQSEDLEEFWNHLIEQRNLITEIPDDRFDWRKFTDPRMKWGGFMKEVDKFDASFFGISPREAEVMDPQHRLFLEVAWSAIEDAGYKPSDLSGTDTGIFVGIGTQDYGQLLDQHLTESNPYVLTGRTPFMLVNRISSLLNLHGPSEPVDTACSSSLVAVHKAVEAIRSGACKMAIAGGVNIILTPTVHLAFSEAGMLSDNGECNVFAANANGTVRSEGVGAILLKKLSDAIADGDHIHALIRGSAAKHKGKSASLTAPNASAQAALLIDVYEKAGVDPRTITYIETHSTGTRLGDPIEINGLKQAFTELYNRKGINEVQPHCTLGSLKSNIGHLEAAAGIGAVIKVLLAMRNKMIPGIPSVKEMNPYINFENSSFYIQSKNQPWQRIQANIPRRAGVSAFGFGGVNAHILLEEYMTENAEHKSGTQTLLPVIIVLSAKNEERLGEQAMRLLKALEKREMKDEELINIAYTLQVGREALEERLAFVAASMQELKDKLKAWCAGDQAYSQAVYCGRVNKHDDIVALFAEDEGLEEIVESWANKGEFHKIISLWVKGFAVDWKKLFYQGFKPRRIPLPTYPFERQRHWIPIKNEKKDQAVTTNGFTQVLSESASLSAQRENINREFDVSSGQSLSHAAISEKIIAMLASFLAISSSEVTLSSTLADLAVDSIILTQALQQLQTINPDLDFEALYQCITVQDMVELVAASNQSSEGNNSGNEQTTRLQLTSEQLMSQQAIMQQVQQVNSTAFINKASGERIRYPELVRLNKASEKQPIFWFHGGFGGVEVYRFIAHHIERPFYGIQAKGYMNDEEPIEGIEAMAEYYVQMIQSVQPQGPYDLGGLSLGGMIAYEVARQLQMQGETVNSIIMLESIYADDEMRQHWLSLPPHHLKKDRMLRSVNLLLAFSANEELTLIADQEVELEQSDEAFLEQLITLAIQKDAAKSPVQLRKSVLQLEKILDTLDRSTAIYEVPSLPNPQQTACYYFCNAISSLFGEQESYFRLIDKGTVYDYISFAERWKEKLPTLTVHKVEGSNHLTLLTEAKSQQVILSFCKQLYDGVPVTQ